MLYSLTVLAAPAASTCGGPDITGTWATKVDMATEQVVHVEALVRWVHEKHGLMRPDEFIPLAEQSGKIGMITRYVLRKAILQCATWRAEGIDLSVAVNLSALDLFDTELPTLISGLLSESKLPPDCLVLEIGADRLLGFLHDLRDRFDERCFHRLNFWRSNRRARNKILDRSSDCGRAAICATE